MIWAWFHRNEIRARSGVAGVFSLLFPLLTTGVAAVVMLWPLPSMMGSPLRPIELFQPDAGLVLIDDAATG